MTSFQTIYQFIIYLSPYHLILANNTKNKELKLSEGKPIQLIQG